MTDQVKIQMQRRRTLLCKKRRRQRVFLLALILILGSGAFLFYKEKFYALSEILVWLQQTKPAQVAAAIAPATNRGDIYDRNFRPLAATYETYAVYARPLEMNDPAATASQLAEILGIEQNRLLADLKSQRGFVWIAKGIESRLADSIKELKIKGIYQVVETKRFYPHYETAAHAIGFVEDGQGLDGLEFQYNTLLRGDEINRKELEALHFSADTEISQDTTHLVLSLDLMVQDKIERFLEKRVKITGAASGGILIMDANTGSILAMASYPPFNPNRYWEFSSLSLNNHMVTEPVYPGELALIFQEAAAINLRNERNTEAVDSADDEQPLLVIEPAILKRKKISSAPRIDSVDPEYLVHFAQILGFGQKPLTDMPLKNETAISPSLLLTDPSFHTSALRLLTGFTTLMNNGRSVAPHLLYQAYPKENPVPLEPTLAGREQAISLHPATSNELLDFLAAKWLKITGQGSSSQVPMFFETHRFVASRENSAAPPGAASANLQDDPPSRLTQSLLLGAMPGKNPKLTMIALLSYPESDDQVYQDSLEAFGNKFSVLSPDQELVQKMLYLADQPPPIPSPDFWSNKSTIPAVNSDHPSHGERGPATIADQKKNMPDVTGKSLRAGLQILQHLNLDIKVVGSGRIVSQHPAAGTELKNTTACLLKMHQEI
jgi:cell division protein FtsI (penicillin-binding protein 3)